MITKKMTINIPSGLEARPVALFVQVASRYESSIFVEIKDKRINAKSIMGVITMAAGYNTNLVLKTDGPDEVAAAEDLVQLFESKFEED